MDKDSLYRGVLAGRTGWWWPVRVFLAALSIPYAMAMAARNAYYDRHDDPRAVTVPVISVGNITVGGTGKTPFVVALVQRLQQMGRRPAVVARGYRANREGTNDEERMIRARCPGVVYLADANRRRAVEVVTSGAEADVVVLDDGFQHRRLGRALDIVLVDATCPFGYDRLLPGGLLREPVRSLRRADLIAITRFDQVSGDELGAIQERIQRAAPGVKLINCSHDVISIERLDGQALDGNLQNQRAVVFAGIGNPQAFLSTVGSLGATVVGQRWWPDHHDYRPRDIAELARADRFPDYDIMLTTEKDAVKLRRIEGADSMPIHVVKVSIDFPADADTMLQDALARALGE